MRHHKHFHKRQDDSSGWDNFVEGVGDIFGGDDDITTPTAVVKAPATVFKTVFQTQSKTFEGEIGGWSTVGVPEAPEATETAQAPTTNAAAALTTAGSNPTTTPQSEAEPTTETSVAKTADETSAQTKTTPEAAQLNTAETTLPSSVVPTKSVDLSDHTTLAQATSELTTPTPTTADATGVSTTLGKGAADETSATASSTVEPTADSSSSSSAGAKAGIAFGVLGGILVVGLLVWFFFNKRRNQMEKERLEEERHNEKIGGAAFAGAGRAPSFHERPVSVQTARTSATAPQLSLRPVTQFMPSFGERRSSKGAAMALNLASNQNMSGNRGPQTGNSLWERPTTGHSNHPDNPFGDNGPPTPNNPFDAPENVVGMATTTNTPGSSPIGAAVSSETGANVAAAAVAGAAAGVAAAGLTRKTSIRKESPAPLDLTRHVPMSPVPPSPAGTEFSMSELSPGQSPGPSQGAAAIAAAGGPAQTVVHRVQLEFVPTLEDEMGLQAGQLVRLLHEYDDGWVSLGRKLITSHYLVLTD